MEDLGTPERIVLGVMRGVRWLGRLLRGQVVHLVGGPARARVIVLFACVLALSSAQIATVGAVAPQLERSLHIGNTEIGLLNSVALLIGAVAVIPVGLLVDRARRIPLLAASIVLWSVATLLGAVASSYSTLLLTRVGLGAVAATAGPAIASLSGDYFPSRERGRIYGYILSGEIIGTAAGFVVSGTVASVFSWRVAFALLALPGFFLARALWRTVPEPLRGGQSRLQPGTQNLTSAPPDADSAAGEEPSDSEQAQDDRDLAHDVASRRGFEPNPALVLDSDPNAMSLGAAVRYILSIPTNIAADPRLLARLLLLRRPADVRRRFRSRPLSRQPGDGHARPRPARARRARRHARQRSHHRRARAPRSPAGARVGAGGVLPRCRRAADPRPAGQPPHARDLVRRRRRGADLGGQSSARRRSPGHHALRAVGAGGEHPHVRALARPGARAAAVRRRLRPRRSASCPRRRRSARTPTASSPRRPAPGCR